MTGADKLTDGANLRDGSGKLATGERRQMV